MSADEETENPGPAPDAAGVREFNRRAWDTLVSRGNRWTVPVDAATIAAARRGEWSIVLTPTRPVPRDWFPPLAGLDVLCLASGGGQQAPILAAAGARVTVLDNSPAQLAQDRHVAGRDALELRTVEGDMADLSGFAAATFGLVFHPCSNVFVPDVRPVWREAFRVLRPGGVLLAGIVHPVRFIFDEARADRGELVVRHTLPYTDLGSLEPAEYREFLATGEPLAFSHSLEDQLGGQLEAGFVLTALFEDTAPDSAMSRYFPPFLATRAIKP